MQELLLLQGEGNEKPPWRDPPFISKNTSEAAWGVRGESPRAAAYA